LVASFPLSLASLVDLIEFTSIDWELDRFVETSGLGTGESLEAELAPPLWRAEAETIPMTNDAAKQLMARFYLLDGGQETFYLTNPLALYPVADPTGSILGAAAVKVKSVSTDNKALALKSLPNAYALTIGDFLAVDYGTPSRRALFIVCASGAADSGGETAELELRPHVRPGVVADCAVTLLKPSAKVKLLPDTLQLVGKDNLNSSIRFSARQTLQAG
jgi:hypothetical protein